MSTAELNYCRTSGINFKAWQTAAAGSENTYVKAICVRARGRFDQNHVATSLSTKDRLIIANFMPSNWCNRIKHRLRFCRSAQPDDLVVCQYLTERRFVLYNSNLLVPTRLFQRKRLSNLIEGGADSPRLPVTGRFGKP